MGSDRYGFCTYHWSTVAILPFITSIRTKWSFLSQIWFRSIIMDQCCGLPCAQVWLTCGSERAWAWPVCYAGLDRVTQADCELVVGRDRVRRAESMSAGHNCSWTSCRNHCLHCQSRGRSDKARGPYQSPIISQVPCLLARSSNQHVSSSQRRSKP